LNSTLKSILEKTWKTGVERPVKGYVLNITAGSDEIFSLIQGENTTNYKGSIQPIPRRGTSYNVEFRAYY